MESYIKLLLNGNEALNSRISSSLHSIKVTQVDSAIEEISETFTEKHPPHLIFSNHQRVSTDSSIEWLSKYVKKHSIIEY